MASADLYRTNADVRGTSISPLVAKLVPAYRTEAEAQEAARNDEEHAANEFWTRLVRLTLAAQS